jgi:hypothetical protein
MKKWLIFLLLVIPILFGFRATRMIGSHAGGGVPAAGASYCDDGSGTWIGAPGDAEKFEYQAGDFCTTEFSEIDNSTAIDPYSADSELFGTYGLEVTGDSDNGTDDQIQATISDDATVFFALPFRLRAGNDVAGDWYLVGFDDDTGAINTNRLWWIKINSSEQVIFKGSSQASDYFSLSADQWYCLKIESVNNGTSKAYLKSWGGSSWSTVFTSVGDPDESLDVTTYNRLYPWYFKISGRHENATAAIFDFDTIIMSTDSMPSCPTSE